MVYTTDVAVQLTFWFKAQLQVGYQKRGGGGESAAIKKKRHNSTPMDFVSSIFNMSCIFEHYDVSLIEITCIIIGL